MPLLLYLCNTSRYNPDTHDVVGMCRKLEELFEMKFSGCPSDDPADPANSRPTPVQHGLLVPHTLQVFRILVF
jgi:hypothetical protein